jgi:peptidoglycan glycosyltransferase
VNKPITRLAVAAVVLISALIVATTYWQVWAAAGLRDRQDNALQRVAEFTIERGGIYANGGRVPVATNVERKSGGKTFFFREYPQHRLFAHAVGYSTQGRARAGLEQSLNDYLTASNANLSTVLDKTLDELRGETIEGNDVHITLDPTAQRTALRALGSLCGAVVVLEPRSGRVLVLASTPTYDPNLIERNFQQAQRAPGAQCSNPDPLFDRATQGLYAPGSTFKVVTGAAAHESGEFDLSSTFVDPGYCEEYGRRVNNYDTSRPFGRVDFVQAMQYSINSVFCNIGKQLGGRAILEQGQRFGFYAKPPLETPVDERRASGLYEDGKLFFPKNDTQVDPGRLAFGQERMLVTPLQMAMVAGAVAAGGLVMEPHLVDRIVAPDGEAIRTTEARRLGRAISQKTADRLTIQMKAVVAGGTATVVQLDVPGGVAGKTGTAETGRSGVNTTSFIGFAPAERPRLAIAVIVEQQAGTGGRIAAPIAREVMQAVLRRR